MSREYTYFYHLVNVISLSKWSHLKVNSRKTAVACFWSLIVLRVCKRLKRQTERQIGKKSKKVNEEWRKDFANKIVCLWMGQRERERKRESECLTIEKSLQKNEHVSSVWYENIQFNVLTSSFEKKTSHTVTSVTSLLLIDFSLIIDVWNISSFSLLIAVAITLTSIETFRCCCSKHVSAYKMFRKLKLI